MLAIVSYNECYVPPTLSIQLMLHLPMAHIYALSEIYVFNYEIKDINGSLMGFKIL